MKRLIEGRCVRRGAALLAVAAGWLILAGAAGAPGAPGTAAPKTRAASGMGEWPTLTPGMWRFHRVLMRVGRNAPPDTITNSTCADPVQDMHTQDARLTKMGCTFTSPVRKGNTYTFGSSCTIQGRSASSTSVLTVAGPGAYRLVVNAQMGPDATREILEARRIGDCPK